ncbi:hypothetical protein, partial [Bartonella florencae]|uniref:hypothetical protein n=1 Tax=Bartonella florencae TaxID=928210 RepID=UPI0012EAC7ED
MKILIIIGMVIFFGMSNSALAYGSQDELKATSGQVDRIVRIHEFLKGRRLKFEPQNLSKEQLEATRAHVDQIIKIRESITGKRLGVKFGKEGDSSLVLMNPKYIYDESKETGIHSNFPILIRNIKKQEEYSGKSTDEIRELINLRSQYTSIVDKIVSLQNFEHAENRFRQIILHLAAISGAQDLKAIAELQVNFKAINAMIQNEAI